MRCGKCGRNAADVGEVRRCYDGVADAHKPTSPPSEAQVDYLLGLQEDRIIPDGYVVKSKAEIWLMERPEVSAQISMLKLCQRKDAGKGRHQWSMPEGRYAILEEFGTDNNEDAMWTFWQVDKPTEGRWEGYTFLKQLIGAPGTYKKINVENRRRQEVLRAIEADPKQAMIDYGLKSGVCGRCSSPLTDPGSLARGIGPKCAAKSGWF